MNGNSYVVLVTGCSGDFGERIARTLAQTGHDVYASMRDVKGRNKDASARLTQWAKEASASLSVIELDVTNDDSVNGAVAHILDKSGPIDVAINNAATGSIGPIEAFSMEQIKAIFDSNVFGPIRVHKAVLPLMRERRSGLIIEITSVGGRVFRTGGLYPSTKKAQEAIGESLRNEVAPFGIDVAMIEPGSYPTGTFAKSSIGSQHEIMSAYAAVQPPPPPKVVPSADYVLPDPQEIADAVSRVVEAPAGQRPFRTVVGRVLSEGVAEFNEAYDRAHIKLRESARRPDQATPWL